MQLGSTIVIVQLCKFCQWGQRGGGDNEGPMQRKWILFIPSHLGVLDKRCVCQVNKDVKSAVCSHGSDRFHCMCHVQMDKGDHCYCQSMKKGTWFKRPKTETYWKVILLTCYWVHKILQSSAMMEQHVNCATAVN